MSFLRNHSTAGLAVAGVATAAGLMLTGVGVYAGLNATASNTTAQAVSSGTLSLTMAANGVGFSQSVSTLAPGDVVNRYIDLTNGGQLAGQALTLGVSDATPTKLTTDSTNGLHVTVSQCSGGLAPAWSATLGTCTGVGATSSTLLNNVPLNGLTAASLIAGAQAAGTVDHLQISLTLPVTAANNETTVNGALPTGTIQGLTAGLTWTFTEAQRTATTTTS